MQFGDSENENLTQPAVELLQSLIRIPSPNPPGDAAAIAAFIAEWIEQHAPGARVRVLAPESKPEAQSVVAEIGAPSNTAAQVIMLHAHIDTVPIAGDEAGRWTVDPYAGAICDGRVYGKGSIDDKAPLAAMLIAFAQFAEHLQTHPQADTSLVLVAAAEEETGGRLGTKWLAESGHLPLCDFIIVGEQTGNRVANAHKGVLRATVRATGRSVHATNPDRGVNAIVAMAKAVLALDAYHQQLAARVHPAVGVPTCNVGVIVGGSTANAVPDSCFVHLDRRMIPGENPADVMAELEAVIDSVDTGAAHLRVGDYQVSNWYSSSVEGALSKLFLQIVAQETQAEPGPIGYLPGSDAKHLTGCLKPGGEMIIFGPGSYEVAHAADEYTEIADLARTTTILNRFVLSQPNPAPVAQAEAAR